MLQFADGDSSAISSEIDPPVNLNEKVLIDTKQKQPQQAKLGLPSPLLQLIIEPSLVLSNITFCFHLRCLLMIEQL